MACLLAVVFPDATHAQEYDGGALLRQQDLPDAPGTGGRKKPKIDPIPTVSTGKKDNGKHGGNTIFVKAYRLTGLPQGMSESAILEKLSDLSGRTLHFQELQIAAERVTAAMQAQGFTFSLAYVPRQEVHEGVVVIDVLLGRRSTGEMSNGDIALRFDKTLRISPDFAKSMAASALVPGEPVTVEQIERGLLLLNSLPATRASGVAVPGPEEGTVGLAIQVDEAPQVDLAIVADNHSSEAMGEYRVAIDLGINGLAGRGDRLALRMSKTLEIDHVGFSYLLPVGTDGATVRLDASHVRYGGVDNDLLKPNGHARQISLGIRYPFILTRRRHLAGSLQFAAKDVSDSLGAAPLSDRSVKSITFGMQDLHAHDDGNGSGLIAGLLTIGDIDLGRLPDELEQNLATRRTAGTYAVLRAHGAYSRAVSSDTSIQFRAETQLSFKNLDSSEKLYPGGMQGVRAFPIDYPGGDEGTVMNFEMKWKPARTEPWKNISIMPFIDMALVRKNKKPWNGWNADTPGLKNRIAIKGLGLSLTYDDPDVGRFDFVYARRLGGDPNAVGDSSIRPVGRSRLWISGVVNF